MGIVFFEDFSQDVLSSIAARYPDSQRYVLGTDIGGWPLAKNTTTAKWKSLPLNTSYRTELYLEFEDNGYATRTTLVPCFYGIILYANTASDLYVYTATATGAAATVALRAPIGIAVRAITRLYIDVDFSTRTITMLVNGVVIFNKYPMPADWQTWYLPSADSAVYLYNTSGCAWLNTVKKIVIATDNPAGKMLDVDNLQFVVRDLTYGSSANMSYTDLGYVEDVDKADPTVSTPGLKTETTGQVNYNSTAPNNVLSSKLYAAGWSENPGKYAQVGDGTLRVIPRYVGPTQEQTLTGDMVEVRIVDDRAFTAEMNVTNTAVALSPRFDGASNIVVDWGDGTFTVVDSAGRADHTYLVTGTYTVKITGKCLRLVLASEHLTKVLNWGNLGFSGFQFYKATASGDPELTSPNLVQVPTTLPWNVTDLSNAFFKASSFNQSILNGEWNLRNVRTLYQILAQSGYNHPINITSGAVDFTGLVYQTPLNQSVTINLPMGPKTVLLGTLFSGCLSFNSPFVLNDPYIRTIRTEYMFYNCPAFNQPMRLSIPNVPAAAATYMFAGCTALNQDFSNWCVTSMVSKPAEFDLNCTAWTLPRPVWGTCPL